MQFQIQLKRRKKIKFDKNFYNCKQIQLLY